MPHLCLNNDSYFNSIQDQRLLDAFPGFAARSSASGGMSIDPHAPAAEILALFAGYEIAASRFGRRAEHHVLRRADHLVDIHLNVGRVNFAVYSKAADAREVAAGFERSLEPFKRQNQEEDGLWVDFSYLGGNGVERTTQFLRAPAWAEIRANYPAPARARLDELFELTDPWKRGRLIIWHGPPGTGKTYAIRSLMMHWRARFDYLVINDPERLAKEPAYYYEVASESTEVPERFYRRLDRPRPGDFDDDIPESETPHRKRRCLFILEDCADLVLQESRSHHFDKIGKLLNMTDGLFGQGREDVFLVTFNENVHDIDQAFLRPGRCVANIDFPKFASAEADAWLEANGIASPGLDDAATLAELYERVHRRKGGEPAEQTGGSGGKGFGAGRQR